MFEKVNPSHPDKVADRIAGAIVDAAYKAVANPRIAVEVLLGHGRCYVIAETSVIFAYEQIDGIVRRIAGDGLALEFKQVPQDEHLADNQRDGIRCGDNGIFRGVPTAMEELVLSSLAHEIYAKYPTDGKYVIAGDRLIICQSNASTADLAKRYPSAEINPLGDWTGGPNVDCGATNRKLGSDMGRAVTGGGLHGKDLSKADVAVNIFAHLEAQRRGCAVEFSCAIGDREVGGVPYSKIVEIARGYIDSLGGFEKLAEWGLF